MNAKNYEIYDIITGKKLDKSQIKTEKKYIIYYPDNKWKVRTVCFNETGEISQEQLLNQSDKFTEIKNTLYKILERNCNKNIKINYDTSINLDNIKIEMPVINVSYQNINGIEINRRLSLNSLQDVYVSNNEYEKYIHLENETVNSIQIGNMNSNLNNNNDKFNQFEDSTQFHRSYNKTEKSPSIYHISGIHVNNFQVSKGNMQVYIDKNKKCFDLRTDDGVNGLSEYLQKQKENELES